MSAAPREDAAWRRYPDTEEQFNPQAIPGVNFQAEFARRNGLAAAARARLRGELDVRYGPGPRQLLDIFPAGNGTATIHVYLHGGYWRMGDKASQTHFVEPFAAAGIPCVLPTYDLCPQVTLDQLVAEVMDAIEWVYRNAERIGGAPRVYLSGSSAGAHLCALALGHDWAARGLPDDFIVGAALFTGIYDIEPVLHMSINQLVHLTADRVHANSPFYHPPRHPVPILIEVGGEEPPGWHAQTHEFADAWRAAGCDVGLRVLPGENHFTVLRSLASPDHPLTREMIAQILKG